MRTIFTVFWTHVTIQSASSPKDQLSIYKKYLIMNNYMFFQTQTVWSGLGGHMCGSAEKIVEVGLTGWKLWFVPLQHPNGLFLLKLLGYLYDKLLFYACCLQWP